jgi:hypothetical protein
VPFIRYFASGRGQDAPAIPGEAEAAVMARAAYAVTVVAAGAGHEFRAEVRPISGPVGHLQVGVYWTGSPEAVLTPDAARVWAAAATAAARVAERAMKDPLKPV